ncbi:MAG: hypothetical protein NT129_02470 [Candidatus Aenigmarchaeota archaeon]|nr:hypothetical protein [Candidatus Aenigmarchaeota archaeon]
MSLVYRATLHTITRDIEDFAKKCKSIGIDYAKINPRVEHDLLLDHINYIIDVSGALPYGRKARIAVVKKHAKNIDAKTGDELKNLWKRDILNEASCIKKYLDEKGIKSEISGATLESYCSCSQRGKITL